MQNVKEEEFQKIKTHIEGFDHISNGGLPKGRATLLAGTAGSAKTVFSTQFLAEGVRHDQGGVFVTFEERPEDIRTNMRGLGWDIDTWERQGKWAFVDASPNPEDLEYMVGEYDLGALLARIENAVRRVDASRLCLDSLGSLFMQFNDSGIVRKELFRIMSALKKMGLTTIITAERTEEYGSIARFGVEEFVTDNVILLRNVLEHEKRRRTVEILKFRGTMHQKGEYPFTIMPGEGVIIIPLSAMELVQESTEIRVTSGSRELDEMCGGGFFRDSIILLSGATGTGKTLATCQFIAGGIGDNERCLLLAFEESRDQLFRNAKGWGFDFADMEERGMLKVVCAYPETAGLEDHLITMKNEISEFKPNRVAVDSLSALERVGTFKGFREFVVSLTSFIKSREMAGLYTASTSTLMGGGSVTEKHISTITDSIILLRYVEMFGEMRRGITVLKMRGSMHDKNIREFTIDSNGLHVGKAFRSVTGILAGHPVRVEPEKDERISGMFQADENA
jgi:circadian clock protein KaiC